MEIAILLRMAFRFQAGFFICLSLWVNLARADMALVPQTCTGRDGEFSLTFKDDPKDKELVVVTVTAAKIATGIKKFKSVFVGENGGMRCYPTAQIDKAQIPKNLKDSRGLLLQIKFGDTEYEGNCTGSAISRIKVGQFCRYQILTAAHCLRRIWDEKTNKVEIASKLILPQLAEDLATDLGEIGDLEVAPHPQYVPNTESPFDIGVLSFTAKCLSEKQLPLFKLAEAMPTHAEACTVLGVHGPYLGTADRGLPDEHNFGVDWSAHESKNGDRRAPTKGWSGSAILQNDKVVGCFFGQENSDPPYGICSGGECLSWARKESERQLKKK